MQSIPIKTPWKNQKRIFFRQFKKGEPYYYHRSGFNQKDGSFYSSFERLQAHCNEWYAVVYLGIDEFNEHAYYSVLGWRPHGSMKETKVALEKYHATQKHLGLDKLPPYCTEEETEEAIKIHFAA